ncbi:hypothetical protein KP509_32G075700 [Ceratopteris richardii]|uniref:Kiwellin-like n=1 Tax=Ceratopteris richardii TaxID=49495 RepID=A0A8T2QW25_CERRI|nr:hypothetical protein KP509_32G075600 [Ceratopteris richardii]KAH7287804.1 hypothetical protein KP509_32G075700 [Ceratopteris richardii]
MGTRMYSSSMYCIFALVMLWPHSRAQQSCGGSCNTLDDCAGQLICINGRCNDDPDVGTHICTGTSSGGSSSGGGSCPATSGNSDSCCASHSCHTSSCSPAVTSSTSAILTLNDFSQGGDGGAPSECDGKYHANTEKVVALSTGWYHGGSRCGRYITIRGNGRSTTAKVVDECDSQNGCDADHAGQPPCANNIVDGSAAVWKALGVSSSDSRYGYMSITWADA